jgi:hypothetical protein
MANRPVFGHHGDPRHQQTHLGASPDEQRASPLSLAPPFLLRHSSRLAQPLLPRLTRDRRASALDSVDDDSAVPGLPPEYLDSFMLAYPFPNYAIAVLPNAAFWYEVQPTGPGNIDLKTHLLLPPHLMTAPGLRARIARNESLFRAIHEEDIVVCSGVQRGAASPSARRGVLSAHERHNRTFASWYSRKMGIRADGTCGWDEGRIGSS